MRGEKRGLDHTTPLLRMVYRDAMPEPILRSPAEAAAAACRKGLVARRVTSGEIRR